MAYARNSRPEDKLPILAVLTLVSLLIPMEFKVSGLLLTPSRVLFLFTVPVLLIQLFGGRMGRLQIVDGLVFCYCFWMGMGVLIHAPRVFVTFVGSNVLIILGGYLTARSTIRSPGQFHGLTKLLVFLIILMIPLALAESLNPNARNTPNMILPPLIEKIPGVFSVKDVLYPPRHGLDRAQVVFSHPIHFGLFCSVVFSMVLIGLQDKMASGLRFILAGTVLFACFLSVSSGPLLSAVVQLLLIGYLWLTPKMEHRWRNLAIVGSVVYSILEVLSTRVALFVIVSMLSFSPHTANVRKLLFDYSMEQIKRTPILGHGFNTASYMPSWMSGSVDNHWLLAAVIYGVPCFVFLFLAFVIPMVQVGRRDFSRSETLTNIRRAWCFVLISVMLSMATVAIWGPIYSYLFFILGSGLWLKEYKVEEGAGVRPEPAARPALRYTRFADAPPRKSPKEPDAPPLYGRMRPGQ